MMRKRWNKLKALSPIIATILLVAIVVVSTLIAYSWIQTFQREVAPREREMHPAEITIDALTTTKLYLRNSSNQSKRVAVYINGKLFTVLDLNAGQVRAIDLPQVELGSLVQVSYDGGSIYEVVNQVGVLTLTLSQILSVEQPKLIESFGGKVFITYYSSAASAYKVAELTYAGGYSLTDLFTAPSGFEIGGIGYGDVDNDDQNELVLAFFDPSTYVNELNYLDNGEMKQIAKFTLDSAVYAIEAKIRLVDLNQDGTNDVIYSLIQHVRMLVGGDVIESEDWNLISFHFDGTSWIKQDLNFSRVADIEVEVESSQDSLLLLSTQQYPEGWVWTLESYSPSTGWQTHLKDHNKGTGFDISKGAFFVQDWNEITEKTRIIEIDSLFNVQAQEVIDGNSFGLFELCDMYPGEGEEIYTQLVDFSTHTARIYVGSVGSLRKELESDIIIERWVCEDLDGDGKQEIYAVGPVGLDSILRLKWE